MSQVIQLLTRFNEEGSGPKTLLCQRLYPRYNAPLKKIGPRYSRSSCLRLPPVHVK